MIDVVKISELVLARLSTIGYEKNSFVSSGQLIFPSKSDDKRISEQELRQLFIEEFKKKYKERSSKLYYSIETPTVYKYSFTNEPNQIKVGDVNHSGQSALLDMCILEKEDEKSNYIRVLNVEFKHKNATHDNISKDILKLMHEEENGVFVVLLKNTDNGTLFNTGKKREGVIDKLNTSIKTHEKQWNKLKKYKQIELIILSLEERDNKENGSPFIMHSTITKSNKDSLDICIDKWEKKVLLHGKFQ